MRRKHLIKKIRKEFECGRCNLCCKVAGYVYLNAKDVKRIAAHLDLSVEDFKSDYCGVDEGRVVLHSRSDDACIFLDDEKGCKINDVKPYQCKAFPFKWRDEDAYDYCHGIKNLDSGGKG